MSSLEAHRKTTQMTNKPHTHITFRPSPLLGESWVGFLHRLCSANRFSNVRSLSIILQIDEGVLLRFPSSKFLLKLGYDSARVDSIFSEPHLNIEKSIPRSFSWPSPKVCIDCLREDSVPFYRAAWTLPLSVSCQKHGTQLTYACPTCGQHMKHNRSAGFRCECGISYLNWTSLPAPEPSGLLYELMNVDPPTGYETFATASAHECRAYVTLSRLAFLTGFDQPSGYKRLSNHADRAAIIFYCETLFHEHQNPITTKSAETKFRRPFSRPAQIQEKLLYIDYFPRLKSHLYQAFATPANTPGKRVHWTTDSKAALVCPIDICRLLKISYVTTLRMVRAGAFCNVTSKPVRMKNTYLIPYSDVLEMAESLRSSASLSEASRFLGISTSSLQFLEHIGCIRFRVLNIKGLSPYETLRMARKEAIQLRREVLSNVRNIEDTSKLISFQKLIRLLKTKFSREAANVVLQNIKESIVSKYATRATALSIGDLFFDPSDIQKHS